MLLWVLNLTMRPNLHVLQKRTIYFKNAEDKDT